MTQPPDPRASAAEGLGTFPGRGQVGGPSAVWRRARTLASSERRLAAMASTIFSGQVVSGLLGFVFWTLAARSLSAADLGVSGASTAAMTLIGPLGMFGVGTLLISELPRHAAGARRRLVSTGLGVVVTAAGLIGLLFVLLGAPFLDSYRALLVSPWTAVCFVVGCALTGLSNVFDQVMLVVGVPAAQVARTAVAGVVKLAVLVLLLRLSFPSGVGATLLAWTIGLLASGGLAARALARHLPSSDAGRPPVRTLLRRLTSPALQHHGVNIALFSGSLLQPVLIGAVLPAQANADFTAARLATLFAFLAPFALAMAFFASSAETPRAVAGRSASITLASLGVAVVLTVVLWLGGGLVLEIFGGHYEKALTALRIMSLAVPLLVFKDQYIALARATRRIRSILVAVVVAAVLEVAGTLSGSLLHGLDGALIGWVGVLGVEALYSIWGLRQIRREMAVTADEPEQFTPTRDMEPVASADSSGEAF